MGGMSLLTLDDVTLRMAGRTLLDHASLRIDAGARVAWLVAMARAKARC